MLDMKEFANSLEKFLNEGVENEGFVYLDVSTAEARAIVEAIRFKEENNA